MGLSGPIAMKLERNKRMYLEIKYSPNCKGFDCVSRSISGALLPSNPQPALAVCGIRLPAPQRRSDACLCQVCRDKEHQ